MKKFIIQITKQAGDYLLKNFKKDEKLGKLRGSVKGITTKYDIFADKMIIDKIRKKYPDHDLLTEENGSFKNGSDWKWIIDPLDGTGNYANGNPFFAVCIALMHGDKLKYGTIYAPAINEFYYAEAGKGAFLNNKKIKVSNTKRLQDSYALICEGGEIKRKRILELIDKFYKNVHDLRKLGSAGIEAAWVASGKVDFYITTKIRPWDVAAGVLLVEEAGGKVNNFKEKKWECKTDDLIFSNKNLHNKIKGID